MLTVNCNLIPKIQRLSINVDCSQGEEGMLLLMTFYKGLPTVVLRLHTNKVREPGTSKGNQTQDNNSQSGVTD